MERGCKKNDGRSTVYNYITSEEKLAQVNPENLELQKDFLDYLVSIDRSKGTIYQYNANLNVFFCWNLEYNKNKPFPKLTKREIARFQTHAMSEWGWSSKRLRTVKATISSLSNFIENILDDEYEGYKPIVNKIESPPDVAVRKKTIYKTRELQKILDKLVEDGEYEKACALSLAMNSGRRKAELVRYKVDYFKPENLICEGAVYRTPEEVTTKGRGSMGKLLVLYTLAKPFNPYLNLWLEERKRLGIRSQWLFPRFKNGKYLNEPAPVSTLDSWGKLFTKISGKKFYWHSMRHYITTTLLESNLPESVVQLFIGWETSDMVHNYDDREKDAQFEEWFGSDGIKSKRKTSLKEL